MTRREHFESLELTVRHTEMELFGSMNFRSNIIPMWLDFENFAMANSTSLQLAPVETKAQWDLLREVRRQIEIPFGVVESDKIDAIIANIRRIKSLFSSDWFLAYSKDLVVGSIGLVEFRNSSAPFGRLLDVDILPQSIPVMP